MISTRQSASSSRERANDHGTSHSAVRPPTTRPAALVQRKVACACGGGCPRCLEDENGNIQRKLELGPVNDSYEREANEFAMRKGSPKLADTPAMVRRLPQASVTGTGKSAPPSVHAALSSPGRPLDAQARAGAEAHLGRDLSGVRVHDDSLAGASAEEIDALAYTTGDHIVFAPGSYDPSSVAGQQLLLHELVHFVQQGGEASIVQRAVRDTVIENPLSGAQACVVHLHGNEENARQVGLGLRSTHCVNFVDVSSTDRWLKVDLPSGSTCLSDPNRIFTPAGIAGPALFGTCSDRPAARAEVTTWRDTKLIPAIGKCRGGTGSDLKGPLPIVALHNNDGLTIANYQPGGSEAASTERDPKLLKGVANPAVVKGQSASDYFLTTQTGDFGALRGTRNTVLQSKSPKDDGSLSVALAADRYVNVETFGKEFTKTTDPSFITDQAMALEVMAAFGVGKQPCAAASGTGTPLVAPAPEPEPGSEEEGFWHWLLRLLRSIIRMLEDVSTMPEPLPRLQPPANLPKKCRTFNSQAELDARKTAFASTIARMPVADVIEWIVGIGSPPAAPLLEAQDQMDCLMFGLQAAAAQPGSSIHLPAGKLNQLGRRTFADQRSIWREKFDFTRKLPFDRISSHARAVCGSLIAPSETKWLTFDPAHRACWGVPSSVPLPPGTRTLTEVEREQEILQASSAPGISRHHWGTDFDIIDPNVDPEKWRAGQPFADEYSWLVRNASSYGFIQSFTAMSAIPGPGYMEERWHWSYYPLAQALLEFARARQTEIEARLFTLWGTDQRFSFIGRHWRSFMFSVRERGVF